jgi:hypothetical protein
MAETLKTTGTSEVVIMHLPDDIETPVALQPEQLLGDISYKLVIPAHLSDGDLIAALSQTRVSPATGRIDVRWAIKITAAITKENFDVIYLNADGTEGFVGDRRVHIQGSLGTFVNDQFGTCLKRTVGGPSPEHKPETGARGQVSGQKKN